MKVIVFHGDKAFVTDDLGTRLLPSESLKIDEGDRTFGGPRGEPIPETLRSIRQNAGYTNTVIMGNYMYFTNKPAIPFMLPKPIKAMNGCALEKESVEKIDEAINTLIRYGEDDIWDNTTVIDGVEYRASDCLAAINIVREEIMENVTDTTVSNIVYGPLCAYRSLRDPMPNYIECMTPTQLSKELYEKYNKTNQEM